jgi:hypothetical protein
MPYIAQHFAKASQAPPTGWRGHRFRTSRGFLWLDTPAARKVACEALQAKRDLRRAMVDLGLGPHDAELYARERAQERDPTSWRVWTQPRTKTAITDREKLLPAAVPRLVLLAAVASTYVDLLPPTAWDLLRWPDCLWSP